MNKRAVFATYALCFVMISPVVSRAATTALVQRSREQPRTLIGRVHGSQERPIADAVVYLKNTKTLVVKTYITEDNVAQRGGSAGAGSRMLVGLNISPAGLRPYCPQAQSIFLFLLVHLDDLEVVLLPGLKFRRTAIGIRGFKVMAEPFNSIRNFNER